MPEKSANVMVSRVLISVQPQFAICPVLSGVFSVLARVGGGSVFGTAPSNDLNGRHSPPRLPSQSDIEEWRCLYPLQAAISINR